MEALLRLARKTKPKLLKNEEKNAAAAMRREKWQEQLDSLEKFVAVYTKLLEQLQAPYFDDADRERVADRLSVFQKALDHARSTFEQREQLFETNVKQLQEILEKRQALLDAVDAETHIFELDEELLNYFVQKQHDLQHQLQTVLSKLDELPDPPKLS